MHKKTRMAIKDMKPFLGRPPSLPPISSSSLSSLSSHSSSSLDPDIYEVLRWPREGGEHGDLRTDGVTLGTMNGGTNGIPNGARNGTTNGFTNGSTNRVLEADDPQCLIVSSKEQGEVKLAQDLEERLRREGCAVRTIHAESAAELQTAELGCAGLGGAWLGGAGLVLVLCAGEKVLFQTLKERLCKKVKIKPVYIIRRDGSLNLDSDSLRRNGKLSRIYSESFAGNNSETLRRKSESSLSPCPSPTYPERSSSFWKRLPGNKPKNETYTKPGAQCQPVKCIAYYNRDQKPVQEESYDGSNEMNAIGYHISEAFMHEVMKLFNSKVLAKVKTRKMRVEAPSDEQLLRLCDAARPDWDSFAVDGVLDSTASAFSSSNTREIEHVDVCTQHYEDTVNLHDSVFMLPGLTNFGIPQSREAQVNGSNVSTMNSTTSHSANSHRHRQFTHDACMSNGNRTQNMRPSRDLSPRPHMPIDGTASLPPKFEEVERTDIETIRRSFLDADPNHQHEDATLPRGAEDPGLSGHPEEPPCIACGHPQPVIVKQTFHISFNNCSDITTGVSCSCHT